MFDVFDEKGNLIARAQTNEEKRIYQLWVQHFDSQKVANIMGLPVEQVKKYTESGRGR